MNGIHHILHLSDLHFGATTPSDNWYSQLAEDLKGEDLNCRKLDALIVSGDVANFSTESEYERTKAFLSALTKEFALDAANIVMVPGNHDLNWKLAKKGYALKEREDVEAELVEGCYVPVGDEVVRVQDPAVHPLRFQYFSDLYKKIKKEAYPVDYQDQATLHHLPGLNLLVVGFNSAWQVDPYFKARASISPEAVARALTAIRDDEAYANCRKFAVWHHPLVSPDEDRIKDHGFMQQLAKAGFCVCLHGHIHKANTDQYRYDVTEAGRKIHLVGAGTFGAPVKAWTPGHPLQYNLLKIEGDTLTVETRCRRELNGAWEADAIWRQGPGKDPLPRYFIKLPPLEKVAEAPKNKGTTKKPGPGTTSEDQALAADIQNYRSKIAAFHENLPLMGFRTKLRVPIRIEDIYIPLRAMLDLRATGGACFADAEDAEKKLGRNKECEELALPEAFRTANAMDRRGIVILGDPGSGKTTHLKRLLLWCLRKGVEAMGLPKDMVPVFLPLRELRDLDHGLDAFIQSQLDKPHLRTPEGFGKRLIARGNLLFLLDGLDEVADPDQRAQVARWIDEAANVHPSCRFVVTCRFAGYTDQAQLCAQFLEMHIRPLSFEQVETFVSNWYRIVETGLSTDSRQAEVIADERARDLIERLDKPEFRARRVFELTRNPLLLTNICLVHRDRGNLPHSRDRLYEECTDVLLELWRAAIGYKTKVDARSGRKVLQPAALWLHQEEGRTRARADELAPVIEPALKAAGWPHGNAEDFLQVVRDESGLLTGWDQEQYGFMHLGFQEYLAALEIQNNCLLDPKVLTELAIRFGQSWWQEVTLLLLSLGNPCPFVPFMRALVHQPGFTQHPDLVEMCLDDAAETPALPFVELLKAKAGKDEEHWQRQLSALKLVERLDADALDELIPLLSKHPYDRIREWLGQQEAQATKDVIQAPTGGYDLVRIPGGEFFMGSPDSEENRYDREGPQHIVHVPDFYMGRYPVTNEEYGRYLAENEDAAVPEYWGNRGYSKSRQPVAGVSWENANQYARWAGLQLPSEAQWEYACRAGKQTRFYSGDTEEELARVGWYVRNSGDKLHSVGEKDPNEFGLYDMHGNVWEWVEDDYHGDYEGAPDDGSAWIDDPRGANRVVRGGSWGIYAWGCRSAFRFGNEPGDRDDGLGFRLVLLPGQPG